MPRYWVDTGFGTEALTGFHEDEMAARRLESEVPGVQEEHDKYVFKTKDIEEAREVKRKAIEIGESFGFQMADVVRINTQPECPNCGWLGRFSDTHCEQCEVELVREYDVE